MASPLSNLVGSKHEQKSSEVSLGLKKYLCRMKIHNIPLEHLLDSAIATKLRATASAQLNIVAV